MKSTVQRLLWQRKLELLERRPVPAAPEVNRHDLWRCAYLLIRSDWLQLVNKGTLVDESYQPPAQQLKELANLAAQGMADTLRRWK